MPHKSSARQVMTSAQLVPNSGSGSNRLTGGDIGHTIITEKKEKKKRKEKADNR